MRGLGDLVQMLVNDYPGPFWAGLTLLVIFCLTCAAVALGSAGRGK